jgi:hypothetical protein
MKRRSPNPNPESVEWLTSSDEVGIFMIAHVVTDRSVTTAPSQRGKLPNE